MEGKQEEKKVLLGKLKDAAEDQEHQIQILGTFVRLGVVVWSGFYHHDELRRITYDKESW